MAAHRTLALVISSFVLPVLAAAGCSSRGTGTPTDDAGAARCSSDTDCDDSIPCTAELCGAGGLCERTPIDERCADGESCIVGVGCRAGESCETSADCADAHECTIDSCASGNVCRHMPIDERCPAETPTCDPVMGCVAGSGCRTAADCDDDIECTFDTCGADMMCDHMALDARCGEGQACSSSMGCFTPMMCMDADDCQNGSFCDGAERCVAEFGCAPAEAPRMCDDGDPCTLDSCDPAAGMGGACVFACDRSRPECGCSAGPSCTGRFSLTGTGLSANCASGMVDYDLSEVTFEILAGGLTVTGRRTSFADMTDMAAPVCPSFVASTTVAGMCAEVYELSGEFTDEDHFTGMFRTSYGGEICELLSGCTATTVMVSGTRIP